MTQQFIVTIPSNSGLGDSPYVAFNKINSNFSDLYSGAPSGLPAATGSLSGLEVVVVNSAGEPETVTTAQIAALGSGSPATVFGNPTGSFGTSGSFSNQISWTNTTCNNTASGGLNGISSYAGSGGLGWTWTGNNGGATEATQAINTAATTIATAVSMAVGTSATGNTNTYVSLYGNAFSSTGVPAFASYRGLASGLPISGFTLTTYFSFVAEQVGQTALVGFVPYASINFGGAQVIANALNILGFGKDSSDTLLYLYYNGASGTATKVSTGITFANIATHMMKLVITCDALGNVTASITDLEPVSNQGTYTASLPAATANLPANGVVLAPYFYVCTGTATTSVKIGVQSVFTAHGFITA
jgi:hypothetical protein